MIFIWKCTQFKWNSGYIDTVEWKVDREEIRRRRRRRRKHFLNQVNVIEKLKHLMMSKCFGLVLPVFFLNVWYFLSIRNENRVICKLLLCLIFSGYCFSLFIIRILNIRYKLTKCTSVLIFVQITKTATG